MREGIGRRSRSSRLAPAARRRDAPAAAIGAGRGPWRSPGTRGAWPRPSDDPRPASRSTGRQERRCADRGPASRRRRAGGGRDGRGERRTRPPRSLLSRRGSISGAVAPFMRGWSSSSRSAQRSPSDRWLRVPPGMLSAHALAWKRGESLPTSWRKANAASQPISGGSKRHTCREFGAHLHNRMAQQRLQYCGDVHRVVGKVVGGATGFVGLAPAWVMVRHRFSLRIPVGLACPLDHRIAFEVVTKINYFHREDPSPLNLLSDSILSASPIGSVTLPGLFAALARDEVRSFPRLRAHQRAAWHMFRVQLAALALDGAGVSEPPQEEGAWRDLLLALTEGMDGPWALVVEDRSRPAFLQPPDPGGLKWDVGCDPGRARSADYLQEPRPEGGGGRRGCAGGLGLRFDLAPDVGWLWWTRQIQYRSHERGFFQSGNAWSCTCRTGRAARSILVVAARPRRGAANRTLRRY